MQLLTADIRARLLANNDNDNLLDLAPVVKFFTPDGAATWLISSIDEDGRLFGICDLGVGFPELGYVMLSELESLAGRLGLPVERDLHATLDQTLGAYLAKAEVNGVLRV